MARTLKRKRGTLPFRRKKRDKTPSKLIQYAPVLSGLAGGLLGTNLSTRSSLFDDDKKPKVDDYELVEKKNKGRELTYRGYTITQTDKECILEIAYDTLDDTVIAIDDLIKSGYIGTNNIPKGKKKWLR